MDLHHITTLEKEKQRLFSSLIQNILTQNANGLQEKLAVLSEKEKIALLASYDEHEQTLINLAAKCNFFNCLKVLISHYTSQALLIKAIEKQDTHGKNAVYGALACQGSESVHLLLKKLGKRAHIALTFRSKDNKNAIEITTQPELLRVITPYVHETKIEFSPSWDYALTQNQPAVTTPKKILNPFKLSLKKRQQEEIKQTLLAARDWLQQHPSLTNTLLLNQLLEKKLTVHFSYTLFKNQIDDIQKPQSGYLDDPTLTNNYFLTHYPILKDALEENKHKTVTQFSSTEPQTYIVVSNNAHPEQSILLKVNKTTVRPQEQNALLDDKHELNLKTQISNVQVISKKNAQTENNGSLENLREAHIQKNINHTVWSKQQFQKAYRKANSLILISKKYGLLNLQITRPIKSNFKKILRSFNYSLLSDIFFNPKRLLTHLSKFHKLISEQAQNHEIKDANDINYIFENYLQHFFSKLSNAALIQLVKKLQVKSTANFFALPDFFTLRMSCPIMQVLYKKIGHEINFGQLEENQYNRLEQEIMLASGRVGYYLQTFVAVLKSVILSRRLAFDYQPTNIDALSEAKEKNLMVYSEHIRAQFDHALVKQIMNQKQKISQRVKGQEHAVDIMQLDNSADIELEATQNFNSPSLFDNK